MAYAYSDDNSKHLKVRFEDVPINRCPSSSCYTSSSCSSSSSSSLDESFDIDQVAVDPSFETKLPDLIEPLGPVASPQTNVWSTQSGSSSQSPQIPLAGGRPSGYDPSRIPSSVFAGKPSSAMDWSVASNESLFSIHVGNNSFSREQYLLMLNKSEEHGKLDEIFNVPTPLTSVAETVQTKTTSASVVIEPVEIDHHSDQSVETESVETESENLEEEETVETTVSSHVEKDSIEAPEETKEIVRQEIKGSAISHSSHESNHSSQSFQFPVLAGHDNHDHVKHPLEQVKEEKQEIPAPEKQHQTDPKTSESDAPLKAIKGSSWFSCFSCCWICPR